MTYSNNFFLLSFFYKEESSMSWVPVKLMHKKSKEICQLKKYENHDSKIKWKNIEIALIFKSMLKNNKSERLNFLINKKANSEGTKKIFHVFSQVFSLFPFLFVNSLTLERLPFLLFTRAYSSGTFFNFKVNKKFESNFIMFKGVNPCKSTSFPDDKQKAWGVSVS